MTKKPIRRYTVDGKPMTPDDLRRLHDYLADIEVIEVISDWDAWKAWANLEESVGHRTDKGVESS
jgi:hypothetical protein